MILKRRIQRGILHGMLLILMALLLGRFAIYPITGEFSYSTRIFLMGLSAISILGHIYTLGFGIWANSILWSEIKRAFPKNTVQIKSIGVITPLDFAYTIERFLAYTPISLFGNRLQNIRIRYDRHLHRKSIEMFKEMFGRLPLGWETGDWSYIARCEAADYLNKDFEDVLYSSFEENVSDQVKTYLKTMRNFDSVA